MVSLVLNAPPSPIRVNPCPSVVSFSPPATRLFSISYKRVRNILKTKTFKSLYLHTHAHSFFGSPAFSTTSQEHTGGYAPGLSDFGILRRPSPRMESFNLRKVRKLKSLLSISSAHSCAFSGLTFPPNPFIFYRLRTSRVDYRGWGVRVHISMWPPASFTKLGGAGQKNRTAGSDCATTGSETKRREPRRVLLGRRNEN
jgi:hypothetical protein